MCAPQGPVSAVTAGFNAPPYPTAHFRPLSLCMLLVPVALGIVLISWRLEAPVIFPRRRVSGAVCVGSTHACRIPWIPLSWCNLLDHHIQQHNMQLHPSLQAWQEMERRMGKGREETGAVSEGQRPAAKCKRDFCSHFDLAGRDPTKSPKFLL
jgi:hypothetical protein